MSTRALFRWAAAALMISGVSLALGMILHPVPPFSGSIATQQWALAHLFWWAGGFLGVPGLAGAYLLQRERTGALGFSGALFAATGSGLIACAMYFEAFIAPSVAARAPELFESYPAGGGWGGFLAAVLASGALIGAGFILFGIAMLRARVLPRWAIVLTILGGIPFGVNFLLPRAVAILAAVAFGAGLMGLGRAVWKLAEPAAAR